jgi:hypothetical protein
VRTAKRQFTFQKALVTKAIYAMGWDGNIRIVADTAGLYTVFRQF